MAVTEVWSADYLWRQLENALLNPIRAFRPRYLPLLMVYFAYGALGLIAVARELLDQEGADAQPRASSPQLAVWITLPWTVKMVFGELVDSVPILGSQRRVYVFIGARPHCRGLAAAGRAAGGWLTFASPENLYRLGAFVTVLGVVIQDVVADAMSTEVVAARESGRHAAPARRRSTASSAWCRCWAACRCRSASSSWRGSAGWLASIYSYETVFLLGLIIPLISVSGALLVRLRARGAARRSTGGFSAAASPSARSC